jgi:hypothetical protein
MANQPTFNVSVQTLDSVGHYFFVSSMLTLTFTMSTLNATTTYVKQPSLYALSSFTTGIAQDVNNLYYIPNGLPITNYPQPVGLLDTHFSLPATPSISNVSLTGMATNANGRSTSSPFTLSPAVIIDQPSYRLVYTTLSQTLAIMNGSLSAGYRIITNPLNYLTSATNYPLRTIFGYGDYHASGYDNTQDISTGTYQTELQVCNGAFQSVGGNGYRNYIGYYQGTHIQPDYSGISATGYRYATFCWRIQNGLRYNGKIGVSLKNCGGIRVQATGIGVPNAVVSSTGGKPLRIYCRFQDMAGPSYPTTNLYITSGWIDLNSIIDSNNNNIVVNGANYYNDNHTEPTYILAGLSNTLAWSASGPDIVFTTGTSTVLPAGTIVNDTSYFYVTVGLPMDVAVSFGYVQAALT